MNTLLLTLYIIPCIILLIVVASSYNSSKLRANTDNLFMGTFIIFAFIPILNLYIVMRALEEIYTRRNRNGT